MIFYLLNSLTTSNRDATDIVVLAAFGQPHTNRARGGGSMTPYPSTVSPLFYISFSLLVGGGAIDFAGCLEIPKTGKGPA